MMTKNLARSQTENNLQQNMQISENNYQEPTIEFYQYQESALEYESAIIEEQDHPVQTIPPGQIDQRYEEIIQMMSDFKNSLSQKIQMF